MSIKKIEQKIKELEAQRDKLQFEKEFRGLKEPRLDFFTLSEIGQAYQVSDEARMQYERLMKGMLHQAFNEVKNVCWDYWLKKNGKGTSKTVAKYLTRVR